MDDDEKRWESEKGIGRRNNIFNRFVGQKYYMSTKNWKQKRRWRTNIADGIEIIKESGMLVELAAAAVDVCTGWTY